MLAESRETRKLSLESYKWRKRRKYILTYQACQYKSVDMSNCWYRGINPLAEDAQTLCRLGPQVPELPSGQRPR